MPYDQTRAQAGRYLPDILFGSATLALAILAGLCLKGAPFGPPGRPGDWWFPAAIASLLGVVSLGLIVRGKLIGHRDGARWSPRDIAIVAALAAGSALAWEHWGQAFMLDFGPAEYATMMVCALAIAVALARLSRLRALAMVLVGLLLATVGTDLESGDVRFTMGSIHLADGIDAGVLRLGLFVVGDALLCLASPSLYLGSYARWVAGWFDRPISTGVGLGLRGAGAIAVAAASYSAHALNNAIWDVGALLVFGIAGVACKLVGANRVVLVMAFGFGILIEENIRRALLISRGDPFTFLRWPYSAGMLILACVVLVAGTLLSLRRTARPINT
jgi:Tripartite tricarboxylate transporter TctA family